MSKYIPRTNICGGPRRDIVGHRLIALTGYGREADIALAREAGVGGQLVRPCYLDRLERLNTVTGSMRERGVPEADRESKGSST